MKKKTERTDNTICYNKMKKKTNNDQQHTTQKAINFATRGPQTNGGRPTYVNIFSALKFHCL